MNEDGSYVPLRMSRPFAPGAAAGGGAVEFDNTAQALSTDSATCSTNYASSGSNRALFVGVGVRGDGGASVTGVTCNGVAMTELWQLATSGDRCCGFAILNPPTSSVAIVATHGDVASNIGLTIISMTGVNQTTGWGTPQTNSGAASPATVTVTGVGANDLLCDAMETQSGGSPTFGADQTARQILELGSATNFLASSTQPGSAGGEMSWALSSPDWFNIGAVAFKPV